MTQYPPYPPQPFGFAEQTTPTRKSGLAVASLILGVLGFCTGGIAGLIGLILGLISLSAINKSQGQLGGKSLAVAGVSVSASSMAIGCVLFGMIGIMLPAIGKAREQARAARVQLHLRELYNAQADYTSAHVDVMPPPDDWINALTPYVKSPDIHALLNAPGDDAGQRMIAMNMNLGGVKWTKIDRPDRTPLFFEIDPGGAMSGGPELLPARPTFGLGYLFVFVDGHVDRVPAADVHRLAWNP